MRIRYILIVLGLLLVAMSFKFTTTLTQTDAVNTSKPSAIVEKEDTIKSNENENTATKPKQISGDEVKTITTVYDSDPVVDAHLIIYNNKSCYRYLSYSQKNLERLEMKLDDKQKQFYAQFRNHCQEINASHPEYDITDITLLNKQKNNAIATSYWGQILNGEINVTNLNDFEISTLLKQNKLNILNQAPKFLESYYKKIIHWELEDVLQNHQYDYVNYIRYLAHQLYLCQLGDNCSHNSNIMVNLCYVNPQSCGLEYPQYIQTILTQGQQADIQLAINYLKTQYQ